MRGFKKNLNQEIFTEPLPWPETILGTQETSRNQTKALISWALQSRVGERELTKKLIYNVMFNVGKCFYKNKTV